MSAFLEAQTRAKKLTPQKIKIDLFNFIRTLEKTFADLNREALNKDSKDVFGKDVGFYSKATDVITTWEFIQGKRNDIKAEGEPFTLKEENDFLPSIFAKVEKDSIFFDATDPKKKKVLANTLTPDLFGLRDEDLTTAIEERILPFTQKYFKENM